MLSLRELERAARVLTDEFGGGRIERWMQPDAERLVLTVYRRDPASGAGGKRHVLLSAAPEVARVSALAKLPPATAQPPALTSYLRKHLSRARLLRARIRDGDRQLALRFESREGDFELVLCLFGRRSNVYLLDAEDVVRAALRPARDTRPELAVGEKFRSPGRTVPVAGEDRFADTEDSGYLAAVEFHYAGEEEERGSDDLARRLLKAIRKEAKNAERRLARVESELAETDEVNDLQRRGELLKSSLAKVETGAAEVTVRDYAKDEDVVIPLDPTKSPKANMEAIFKRYHKLLRRLTKAGGQLDAAREWRDEIVALQQRVTGLVDSPAGEEVRSALEEVAARPEIARLLDRPVPERRDEPAATSKLPPLLQNVPRRLLPRRYKSRDDLEIWVGRSDEANDHLSTRLARGKDLFFHLDGAPGSHVILRTEGRPDPPQESVLDACELAVHFSKQKNAGRADVHVVPIKNVKKPKGAKKGLVYVTGGKTVHLRREEARLERVLASKLDD